MPRPIQRRVRHDAQGTTTMTAPTTFFVLDLLLNGYLCGTI